MGESFDLIVIGAGSGGLGAAMGMNQLGLNVLLIDRTAGDMGGECLNTACVPSKALLHVANQIHQTKNALRFGLKTGGDIDIQKIKDYINSKQKKIRRHENADYLKSLGITVELGTASFISKNEVQVNKKVFTGKNILIATGSSPKVISIPGSGKIPVFTNENIFQIEFIPGHFVFIGAGPVSIELGQAFSRLGSKVTIIDHGKRILKKEDPYIADILVQRLKAEKIEFLYKSEVIRIVEDKKVVIKNVSGTETTLLADALFMGIGRSLTFKDLNLEKAGVKTSRGKIILNNKLQTSNKNIFVSGDATAGIKFSHAAEMHNMLLINNFLSPFKKHLELKNFPWVTYTDPAIASFGLLEKDLKKRKINYERLETGLNEADRPVIDGYEDGRLLLFIEKKRFNPYNAKILGGSLVAPNADKIIQELILANSAGLKVKDIMNKIYPYPTTANIHKIILRKRITQQIPGWTKALMRKWYRFKK